MSDGPEHGICPSCDAPGRVGDACTARRCARLGYHHIPRAHFSPSDRLPDPLIGQMWQSYLLVAKLGAGGVGAVYLALQQPVGLRTALKVLHLRPKAGGMLAERFGAEATALARLAHPNIVRLLGSGTAHERAYLAMEFIEGGRTLSDAMKAGLDLDAARRILLQMIDALDSAHRVNVIHRDIKPANVMLQATGREPYFVRIVDFGLVKFTDDGDSTQLAAGTPVYMAPEQLRRDDIGPWTDWYAIGVIACEMLLGRRPFPKMSSHALMRLKARGQIDPLAEVGDDEPPSVRHLIARTLAHDPLERPRTADEMVALVEAAFDARSGLPVRPTLLDSTSDAIEPITPSTSHLGGELDGRVGEPTASWGRWGGVALVLLLVISAVAGWLLQDVAEESPPANPSGAPEVVQLVVQAHETVDSPPPVAVDAADASAAAQVAADAAVDDSADAGRVREAQPAEPRAAEPKPPPRQSPRRERAAEATPRAAPPPRPTKPARAAPRPEPPEPRPSEPARVAPQPVPPAPPAEPAVQPVPLPEKGLPMEIDEL